MILSFRVKENYSVGLQIDGHDASASLRYDVCHPHATCEHFSGRKSELRVFAVFEAGSVGLSRALLPYRPPSYRPSRHARDLVPKRRGYVRIGAINISIAFMMCAEYDRGFSMLLLSTICSIAHTLQTGQASDRLTELLP